MKRMFAGFLLLASVCAEPAYAAPVTGSISSNSGGGLIATASWDSGGADLSWSVDYIAGFWNYNYRFSVDSKAISHVLVETSPTFTDANVSTGTTTGWLLDTWGTQGNSNPGLPSPLYGLKFSPAGGILDFSWSIVTDRSPIWGDFYAKDGKDSNGTVDVIAYNASFGGTSAARYSDNAPFGFVLVPDSSDGPPLRVSEPTTMALWGAGLLGLMRLSSSRKRRIKRQ